MAASAETVRRAVKYYYRLRDSGEHEDWTAQTALAFETTPRTILRWVAAYEQRHAGGLTHRRFLSILDRIEGQVLKLPTGCWLWPSTHKVLGQDYVHVYVHRVLWDDKYQEELENWEVLYNTCGDPRCVNPDHHECKDRRPANDDV